MNGARWQLPVWLLLGTSVLGNSGQALGDETGAAETSAVNAPVTRRTDVYGDPLPADARARMGTLRWRQSEPITFVGFTSGGKQVLSAGADGFFRVWNVETGKEVRRFRAPGGNMAGGSFVNGTALLRVGGIGGRIILSPDGSTLAIVGSDARIRLLDVATAKEVRALTMPAAGNARARVYGAGGAAFTPDGKTLAVQGGDLAIHLWEVGTGKEMRVFGKRGGDPNRTPAIVFFAARLGNTLAFAPDGKSLAVSSIETENMQMPSLAIRLYDVDSGQEKRFIKPKDINFRFGITGGMVFAPDGKSVALQGQGSIRFYDLASGKEVRQLQDAQLLPAIATMIAAPGGRIVAVQSPNAAGVQLWDLQTGQKLHRLGDKSPVAGRVAVRFTGVAPGSQSVAFSPDAKVLAEATSGNTIRLWDTASGKEIRKGEGHATGVTGLSVSADGKTLTTYARGKSLCQWDVASGKELRRLDLPPSSTVALSSDGKLAAAQTLGGTIELWDMAAGKQIRTIRMAAVQAPGIRFGGGMALSTKGKLLAVHGADDNVRVFDCQTGKEAGFLMDPKTIAGNPGVAVRLPFALAGGGGLAIAPDGSTVATTASAAGEMVPGGQVFAGRPGGGNVIRLWKISHGKHPRRFEAQQSGITALTFTPDGRIIATASADGSISLWEVLTGQECLHIDAGIKSPPAAPAPPGNPKGGIRVPQANSTLAVSADGLRLAAGGSDRSVRVWDLRSGQELGRLSGHKGAVLAVAFAPDNRTIVSGSADTTALVWHESLPKTQQPGRTSELTEEDIGRLWRDLSAEPNKAFRAVQKLSAAPDRSLAFLESRLKPAPRVDPRKLEQLGADLDSKDFKIRQQATAGLEKLGELAEPALRKTLEKDPSLETRRRVERLLDIIANEPVPPAEMQRTLRCVWVLEQLHTPGARALLQTLAAGAPGDKLTRHAQEALKRLPD